MLLDVVMPYYGRVDYLVDAVESVLAQDSDALRLTVVDDADPSPEAGDYIRGCGDPRLRHLRNDRNLGLSANFQRCLELVEAPYFTLMGCDDLMLPGYMSAFENSLALEEWDILQPGVSVINSEGEPVDPLADRVKRLIRPRVHGQHRVMTAAEVARSLCVGDWMYFPSLVWRSEKVRGLSFDPDLRVALDLRLLLDVLAGGGRVVLRDEPVFAYRRHAASGSDPGAHGEVRFAEEASVYRRAAQHFQSMGWTGPARMARLRPTSRAHATMGAARSARRGDATAARRLAALALRP